MKQEQEKPVGLPENAFRPLKPGRKVSPHHVTRQTVPGSECMVCHLGYFNGYIILSSSCLSGVKSRSGI